MLADLVRRYGYAPRGTRLDVVSPRRWPGEPASYSVTVTCSYRHDGAPIRPLHISTLRAGTNTAQDFFETVLLLLASGFVPPHSYIVLDNASIHKAREIQPQLSLLLNSNHTELIFLPTYSPEVLHSTFLTYSLNLNSLVCLVVLFCSAILTAAVAGGDCVFDSEELAPMQPSRLDAAQVRDRQWIRACVYCNGSHILSQMLRN